MSKTNRFSKIAIVHAALVLLFAIAPGCGGKVVIDADTQNDGEGESDAGTTGLMCGEEPTVGKIVIICVSIMNGDYCPPAATSPGLLQTLSDVFNVCAETSPTACCDKPALRQVVCDLPPNGNECCYSAHYIENVVCP